MHYIPKVSLHTQRFTLAYPWVYVRKRSGHWGGEKLELALIADQGFLLAAVAHVGIHRACSVVVVARILGGSLSFDGAPLCGRLLLSCPRCPFVGFCLRTLGLGGLLVG